MSLKIVLFLFITSVLHAKLIVISDIDDTVKQANSMGKPHEQAYHFLKKKIYPYSRDLYQELEQNALEQGEDVKFYYVSAAFDFTFKHRKWLKKNHFPTDGSYLRTIGSPDTYTYKMNMVANILRKHLPDPSLKVYFFGDNSSHDEDVYLDSKDALDLNAEIFIRDVASSATEFEGLPLERKEGINYFFSEREFFDFPQFNFISNELIQKIEFSYFARKLIPEYTSKTIYRRILAHEECSSSQCKEEAKSQTTKLLSDYYSRF